MRGGGWRVSTLLGTPKSGTRNEMLTTPGTTPIGLPSRSAPASRPRGEHRERRQIRRGRQRRVCVPDERAAGPVGVLWLLHPHTALQLLYRGRDGRPPAPAPCDGRHCAVVCVRPPGGEGRDVKYRTIVVDPPWPYDDGWPGWGLSREERSALPYPAMTLDEIRDLPVFSLVEPEGYVFVWTTNRYIEDAFSIARSWRLVPRQTIT